MLRFNFLLLEVIFSVCFIESIKELLKVQAITSFLDLVILVFTVILSRFVSVYVKKIVRKYKNK